MVSEVELTRNFHEKLDFTIKKYDWSFGLTEIQKYFKLSINKKLKRPSGLLSFLTLKTFESHKSV